MTATATPPALFAISPGPRNAFTKDNLRYYRWQGRDLPSVTSIRRMAGMPFGLHEWALGKTITRAIEGTQDLQKILSAGTPEAEKAARSWLRNASIEERDAAANLGTRVHDAASEGKTLDKVRSDVAPFLRQYLHWLDAADVEILFSEKQIFNLSLGYAGTFDLIARFRKSGLVYLVDLKTGKGTYCHTPGTRVLTEDLRWVGVETLVVGDRLWAFTEDRVGSGARQWTRSEVTGTGISQAETLRITLENGRTITSTLDHPYLARRSKKGGGNKGESGTVWLQADQLRVGNYLPRFIEPWEADESREAGWLAGMLDGEGCINLSTSGVMRTTISQKPGPVMDRIKQALTERGFEYIERTKTDSGANDLRIMGGRSEQARLLGSTRPTRLLPKFHASKLQGTEDRIVAIKLVGVQDVVNLTTSSGTYFAEGYGSHNTDHALQLVAYAMGEFVGEDDVVNEPASQALVNANGVALLHLRPDGWTFKRVTPTPRMFTAFKGLLDFATFANEFTKIDDLVTATAKGSATP